MSVRTIRSLESAGAKRPRPSTAGRLADALNLVDDHRRGLLDLLDTQNDAAPMLSPTSSDTPAGPADALRALRFRLAWTQQTLATKAGLHLRTISNLERGVAATAQPATARRIAVAAGLTGDELDHLVAVLTGARTHVPSPYRLVGRRVELDRVLELIGQRKIVGVVGPGGIGKTALVMAVAAGFPGDVRVLELADLPAATSLSVALASALGLDDPSPLAIAEAVAHHELLILDNIEHLTELDETLTVLAADVGAPTLLLTSRLPVGAAGDAEVLVEPLQPDDAVTLLRRRAEQVNSLPGWRSDGPFAEISEAVDHVPLSLELLTSWSPVLSPTELLHRLRRPLAVLRRAGANRDERHRRGAPQERRRDDRHHDVRSVIEWSLLLLSDTARALFVELAIHPTSFTLDMAEHLHGDNAPILDSIQELAGAGLLRIDGQNQPTRAGLSPVIREVASEQFVDDDRRSTLFDRRVEWVLALSAVTDEHLISRHQQEWLNRLDQERGHIEATLDHLLQSGSLDAVGVVGGLWRYWHLRSLYRHGTNRIGSALAIEGAQDTDGYGTARYGRAILTYLQGDVPSATIQALEALDVFTERGDEHGRLSTHSLLGMIDQFQGRVIESEQRYRSALDGVDPDTNERAYVTLMSNLASLLAQEGRLQEAIELTEEVAARYESMGDERGAADHLGNLGLWLVAAGDPHRSRTALDEIHAFYTRLGEPAAVAEAESGLAEVAIYLGDVDEAERHLGEAERRLNELDDPWGRSSALALRATLSLLLGQPGLALRQAIRALHLADPLPYANAQLRANLAQSVARAVQGERRAALQSATSTLHLCRAGNPPALVSAALLVATLTDAGSGEANAATDRSDRLAATAVAMARSLPGGPPAVFNLILGLSSDRPDRAEIVGPPSAGGGADLADAALARVDLVLSDLDD